MKTIDELTGELLNEKTLEYMRKNPEPNMPFYRAYERAYKIVVRGEEERQAERVNEYDRRVRAYQSHFKISENTARSRVLDHDQKLARDLKSPLLAHLFRLIDAEVQRGEDFTHAALSILRDPDLVRESARCISNRASATHGAVYQSNWSRGLSESVQGNNEQVSRRWQWLSRWAR